MGSSGDEAEGAEHPPVLEAYVINPNLAMRLVRADYARAWMDRTDARFANRCLPMLLANQAGWELLSEHEFRVVWDGRRGVDALTIEYRNGPLPYPATSHFGHGILTFSLPFLFKTSPGYNLLVRGPANSPKDGISPLEGLVETDWSAATFTVNWQLTRPDFPVDFKIGDPVGMVVPQARGELEAFRPALRQLDEDPEFAERYREWSRDRSRFLVDLKTPGTEAITQRWQKEYFRGVDGGESVPQHQTKLRLQDFPELVPQTGSTTRVSGWSILRDLVIVEDFADRETRQRLVGVHQAVHQARGRLQRERDYNLDPPEMRAGDPQAFELARSLINEMQALIQRHYGAQVGCELAHLRGCTPGFQQALHAGNARVVCPRHGESPEELRRVGCVCDDIRVMPNDTPWRMYTGLLYLSEEYDGGEIVFGEGPNVFGRLYRREVMPRPGLLVLHPSNELYFQHTKPVTSGVRYSMNCWFAADPAHIGKDWR